MQGSVLTKIEWAPTDTNNVELKSQRINVFFFKRVELRQPLLIF